MLIEQYIESIQRRYKLGNATEHTFRGDLQQFIETLLPDVRDRKGRTLAFEDILYYQKMIMALMETDRLMKEIDKIELA